MMIIIDETQQPPWWKVTYLKELKRKCGSRNSSSFTCLRNSYCLREWVLCHSLSMKSLHLNLLALKLKCLLQVNSLIIESIRQLRLRLRFNRLELVQSAFLSFTRQFAVPFYFIGSAWSKCETCYCCCCSRVTGFAYVESSFSLSHTQWTMK